MLGIHLPDALGDVLRAVRLRDLRQVQLEEVVGGELLLFLGTYAPAKLSQRLLVEFEVDVAEDRPHGVIRLAISYILDTQPATLIYEP